MTEEIKRSGLPPLQEVVEQVTMRIITINTKEFTETVKKTTLTLQTAFETEPYNIAASIIHLTDPRIQGFMPSKVWWNENTDSFDVLFYVNTSLPKAVRPFKDNMYLMYFYPRGGTVAYDVNIRLFLDQIKTPLGVAFVIMFGDESYKSVVVESKDPQ